MKKKTKKKVSKKKTTRKKAVVKKEPVGRPPFKLTDKEVEQLTQLAQCGCTNGEIEAVLQHSFSTIYHNYGEVIKEGRNSRNGSLRHKQFQMAMGTWKEKDDGKETAPNVTMLIFLGKNYLGQSDKMQIDNPAFQKLVEDYEKLTPEERIRKAARILESTAEDAHGSINDSRQSVSEKNIH